MPQAIPKYQQIAESVLEKIEQSGGRLTQTQDEMAAQYGVNRLTLRHALAWLEKEGRLTKLSSRSYRIGQELPGAREPRLIGFPLWTESIATLDIQRTEARLRTMQDTHMELARQGYALDAQFVGSENNPDWGKIRELCGKWSAVVLEPWEGESRIAADHPFESIMKRAVIIGAIQDKKCNCVCSDLYSAGQLAVEEFIRLGARRILYTGRKDETISHRLLRLISAEDAASKHSGVEVIHADGGFQAEDAFSAVKRFFFEGGHCDAIFAESSYATSGALRALADLRIRVPGQIQFIGMGASAHFSYMVPKPTVIATGSQSFGQDIARMAIALSKNPTPRPNILTPVQLIQGETTGLAVSSVSWQEPQRDREALFLGSDAL